jgi:hypothetical protein
MDRFNSNDTRNKNMTDSLQERFWSKVDKRGVNDCWEWQAGKTSDGYGRMRANGHRVLAHRISYQLERGQIPKGLWCLHKCDNPGCVNPSHLFLGTHDDNMRDMVSKGRARVPRGSNHWYTTLTEDQVLLIRECLREKVMTHREIGVLFGVAKGVVQSIKIGRTWKHVS